MQTQAAWHSNFFLTLTLCTLHSGISNYRLRLLPNSGVLAPTAKCPEGGLASISISSPAQPSGLGPFPEAAALEGLGQSQTSR